MKSTKNIIISIVSIAILSSLQTSSITAAAVNVGPNFEIINKANQSIGIKVKTASGEFTELIKPSGKSSTKNINSQGTITITVCSKMSAEQESKFGSSKPLTYADTLGCDEFTITPQGKTVFLSWDLEKRPRLYPQSGPLAGFGKVVGMKSASGYSLSNNVSSSLIK